MTDYENEQEKLHKGITKTKGFKYPPVLPIVYYEGTSRWTAARSFHERVYLSDVLGKYIPDFEYLVVPLTSYSNQDLIDKNDELSLVMLINKLRNSAEFVKLQEIPPEYFENLSENTPEYLLRVISKIITVFLAKLNIPKEEIGEFTGKIERREFTMLFDSFEAYDVQETRRVSRAEGKAEGLTEGRTEGAKALLVKLVCRKMKKAMPPEEIAELFEEDVNEVKQICNVAVRYAPDYDIEKITEEVIQKYMRMR